MVWKICFVYLIGLITTVVIRLVDAKIEMIKIKSREAKEEILIFSLLWFIVWALLFVFLGIDRLEKWKAKKAIKAED